MALFWDGDKRSYNSVKSDEITPELISKIVERGERTPELDYVFKNKYPSIERAKFIALILCAVFGIIFFAAGQMTSKYGDPSKSRADRKLIAQSYVGIPMALVPIFYIVLGGDKQSKLRKKAVEAMAFETYWLAITNKAYSSYGKYARFCVESGDITLSVPGDVYRQISNKAFIVIFRDGVNPQIRIFSEDFIYK